MNEDYTNAYRRWLAGAQTDKAIVETIAVKHSSWGTTYLANWDQNFTATLDNGVTRVTFLSSQFNFDLPSMTDTTEQAAGLTVSALDGIIYENLRAMSASDREEPIEIKYRIYFSDDDTTPLTDTITWTVHSVAVTMDTIRAELRSIPLRVRRIGTYYTQENFDVLIYNT